MSAFDLLEARNADFLAFCDSWHGEGRAILPGADWLRERGMDNQADAWEWAANEPDRDSGGDVGGVRPIQSGFRFKWSPLWLTQPVPYRSDLPRNLCRGLTEFKSFPGAIAWFLDRWDVIYGGTMPVIPYGWNNAPEDDWDEFSRWTKRYSDWSDIVALVPEPVPVPAPLPPDEIQIMLNRMIESNFILREATRIT